MNHIPKSTRILTSTNINPAQIIPISTTIWTISSTLFGLKYSYINKDLENYLTIQIFKLQIDTCSSHIVNHLNIVYIQQIKQITPIFVILSVYPPNFASRCVTYKYPKSDKLDEFSCLIYEDLSKREKKVLLDDAPTKKNHRCDQFDCWKTFASLDHLEKHYKERHRKIQLRKKNRCKKCNNYFQTPGEKVAHEIFYKHQ